MAIAPNSASTERMEELLRCSICKEALKEPRTLPCFHSFCKICLATYVEIQQEEAQDEGRNEHLFNCPMCRTQFELGKGESVEQLPSNYFINNMLDILKIQQQAQQLSCESCRGQVPSTCRCTECERYLCENCLTTHNNWLDFKEHIVLTLEELAKPENQAKAKGKPRCQKHGHGSKPLEFYCNTCQDLACINCVVLDHRKPDHDYQPIDVVAEQHKEAFKSIFAVLRKKSEEGKNSLQEIEHATENLQANTKRAKDVILEQEKEILEEFSKKLEHNTSILLGQVDRKHDAVNQTLVKQHNDMKAYVDKVNGSLVFAKNIIEKGSNEEILSLEKEIDLNANDIERKCPKSMQPVHNGSFTCLHAKSTKIIVDNEDLNNLGKIVEPPVELLLESSTILDGNIYHGHQLAEWVEDKKFSWELCYRASNDGWESKDFHRKCDDAGPTLTLIKCGTNVFGGYTDQTWKPQVLNENSSIAKVIFDYDAEDDDELTLQEEDLVKVLDLEEDRWWKGELNGKIGVFPSNYVNLVNGPTPGTAEPEPPKEPGSVWTFKRSDVSFLFSLRNKDNLPSFKCEIYDRRNDRAIYCNPGCGAIFGSYRDLSISNNANTNQTSCSNFGNTYQPPTGYQYDTPQTKALLAGSEYFQPTEIEVFRR